MTHYEPREGYQRAGLYIQCHPFGRTSQYLQPGTYLQQDTGLIVSPLMPDGATLYPWIARLGWIQVPGLPGLPLVYERPENQFDLVYLGQSSTALQAYDDEYPQWDALYTHGKLADLDRADLLKARALGRLREAFARDTADRNSRQNAYLITPCPPTGPAPGFERSAIRKWVNQWRLRRGD